MAGDGVRFDSSGLGPGTVLDGKYEILERIGAGGMGEVFKARHLHLHAFRCIKVMKQGLLADDVYRMRFLREARLATQVHHPNIAVVHDFFVGEGGSYMVTEFIDGTTLRQWSAAHGPFPLPLAADVASQVLSGLEHIHRRGLLHRDISPDNVMLSYDSDQRLEAKIIDLGIAKDVNTVAADKTQAGVLIGNPKYMSPEQLGMLNDDEQLDGRTDLYSLGIVLYEMLLSVPPFASETPQGYIMRHLTQPPARFEESRPGVKVPPGIEQVVLRSLEKDRGRRFGNARELANALEPYLMAPAGMLTRDDVSRLREAPSLLKTMEHKIGPNDLTIAEKPPSTVEKAHQFELSLLDDVRQRESAGDRDALQRLAAAHPRGSVVGNAARDALARLADSRQSAAHAQQLLNETLAFESARNGGRAALEAFVSKYSGGRLLKDAKRLLKQLVDAESARTEPRDFDAAWEGGTTAAWDHYLESHGQSPRAEEARHHRQEAADFELAVTTNTPVMWRAFIKTWPDGRHRLDAALRLRSTRP